MTTRVLRARAAADRLGVSMRTLHRYIASGRLRATQLPSGQWRITADDLDTLLQQPTTPREPLSPMALSAIDRFYQRPLTQSDAMRAQQLMRNYGLTLDDFARMVAAQRGCCAICAKPPKPHAGLHVDHDHATNAVRGLLCRSCNHLLGLARDAAEVLRAAADYLQAGGFTSNGGRTARDTALRPSAQQHDEQQHEDCD